MNWCSIVKYCIRIFSTPTFNRHLFRFIEFFIVSRIAQTILGSY